ncbi:type I restriction-modification system S subunit [Streptococcus pneumoniae]|nr:restriction endonuclease subunit S [Streptococcus pneumoniae]VFI04448.1 type I restriction-modification system S subunit [Streptococcus pneumoniae]
MERDSNNNLLNISIPLPPLALQNEFADFVVQVDKSQLAIQKSLEELETLKKSLMQEYFG